MIARVPSSARSVLLSLKGVSNLPATRRSTTGKFVKAGLQRTLTSCTSASSVTSSANCARRWQAIVRPTRTRSGRPNHRKRSTTVFVRSAGRFWRRVDLFSPT
uniref:(northern house mosquito) hypothetical protein n=1 Tax=Culex pipiens TaxID=7175 RepID=A0A8D8B9P4_CULPI